MSLHQFSKSGPTIDGLPEQTSLQNAIHEPHNAHRDRIIATLTNAYYSTLERGARRLAACCSTARIYIEPTVGKVHPWLNRCRHKLCPFCAKARSAQVAADLMILMKAMKHPRVIVLTVRSNTRPLADQLAALRRWFRILRRKPEWKACVPGGAYTLEVTLNEETKLWHPHVHIICDGEYFPQAVLKRLWHDITGGSKIVWIQKVSDLPGMARELAKYIGKVQHLDQLTDNQLREYALAVNGCRMVQTFGDCHSKKPRDVDEQAEPDPEQYTVSIPRIAWLARRGFGTPLEILPLIASRWPVFASYIWHQQPRLEPVEHLQLRQAKGLAMIRGHAPPRSPPTKTTLVEDYLDERLMKLFRQFHAEDRDGTFDFDETVRFYA